ncbi:Arginine--tRNA ligase [Polystyrenella longa]|uniref:Arginine--tRNA ligase n=1 Tax=Polystyrenella longa TaxID=2528007 RepID=A0A518CQH6_9PLAN|nr:arginine--tRNA ligase [Polystyrenella longa]QDU81454.1 Arginine--tRNA ligase [Polystyrenella longa]
MHPLAVIREQLSPLFQEYVEDPTPFLEMVRPAQDTKFGDFQANFAMPLAKKLGKNPRELADEFVEKLQLEGICESVNVAGPGFINFKFNSEWLISRLGEMQQDERLSIPKAEKPETIIVDYSAPNVAKPMHVGHLRSTVIGNTICRILNFLGHQVYGDNHLGDWGTQFGMIIFGYKNFLNEESFKQASVQELARLYKLVNQLSEYHQLVAKVPELKSKIEATAQQLTDLEVKIDPKDKQQRKALGKLKNDLASLKENLLSAEEKIAVVNGSPELAAQANAHPDIARLAREETAKLHKGDVENLKLWNQFLPLCIAAIEEVYERLDVKFDMILGESYFQPFLGNVVSDLERKGLAQESQGAICVFHEGNEAPFIVQKTDGAYTYATTDLATIKYRVEELKADSILYVVDARQGEHFKLLFETADKWGFDKIDLRHISFGTVLGDDKKPFKTRSGDTVGLESLIDESIQRARQIVDAGDDSKPNPELDNATRQEVAELVGIGAIKYADLRHNRESDYVFNWTKMLATTGDTATYIQYAYARIGGIFREVGADRSELRSDTATVVFTHEAERALGLQLIRFAETIESVVSDYRPNILTAYLFETANSFTAFYGHCHVKNEQDPAIKLSRLVLCDLTARVFQQGLELLGIQTTDKM